jgi:drug/metabolite transporter (DMT)-like permease
MYEFVLPALIASVGWGISPFFEKIVLQNTDVETTLIYKGIFIGIMGLFVFLFNIKHFLKIKEEYHVFEYKQIKVPLLVVSFIGAFFTYVIGNIAYLIALNVNKGPTMFVPLISYIMPIVIITLISYFVMKEKINLKMIAGLIITIFGISFTLYNHE